GGVATTTATMTVDYGVPITNNTAYPGAKPVSIVTTAGVAPTIASVTNASGQIVVQIPPQGANLSFALTAALADLAASGKTPLSAIVAVSPGNGVLIAAGQTTAVVITSILPGITAPKVATGASVGLVLGPGVPVATAGGIVGGFSISVSENYIDMF